MRWDELRDCSFLPYPSRNQERVPGDSSRTFEVVGALDIRSRVVSNHIDALERLTSAISLLQQRQPSLRTFVALRRRLPALVDVEHACALRLVGRPDALERGFECTLGETWLAVRCGPLDVWIAEK